LVIQYHIVTHDDGDKAREHVQADQDSARGAERESADRKERVLHTRVPAVLEQELKRVADALRLPVSNLVRTILEDALSAVDHVGRRAEGELRGVAERLAHERDRLRGGLARWQHVEDSRSTASAETEAAAEDAQAAAGGTIEDAQAGASEALGAAATEPKPYAEVDLGGVLGWQPLILAAERWCASCGRPLGVGEEAFLAVGGTRGEDVVIGRECLPRRPATVAT
jgi:hypothetical protein